MSQAVATRCYQQMRPVFIADVSPEHFRREMEIMRTLDGMPSLPEIDPRDLIEPRFANELL